MSQPVPVSDNTRPGQINESTGRPRNPPGPNPKPDPLVNYHRGRPAASVGDRL